MEKRLGMRVRRNVVNLGMKRTFNKGRLANRVRGHTDHHEDSRDEVHDHEDRDHHEDHTEKHNMEKKRRRK